MPLTSISRPPMRIALRTLPAMILLVFFISCSKKDHEPKPSCLFAGKTATITSQTAKYEWGNEIVLDDEKRLVSARKVDNGEAFTRWKQTATTDYLPQYDGDGFLIQMVETKNEIYEGTPGFSYQYYNNNYLKFSTKSTTTSDYRYESGHVTSVTTKTIVRSQGDADPAIVLESEQSKKYTYDSQNVVLSAVTTTPTGSIVTTFKNGIIASEISKNASGAVVMEILYDDKGQRKLMKGSNYMYEFIFDSRGNMQSVKFTQDGKPNFLQEFKYDDHVNPETHIPRKFKGIPENVETVISTDGVNNKIGEKSTSYIGAPNYDNEFNYQYNADGLPESWAPKAGGSGQTMITTFRYKCP